jgi:required for meiotic nuclear division protein 1
VITLATAERFNLARLRPFLSHYAQPLAEAWWVPRWSATESEGAPEGEVFVFANGSFVCWGLPEADARAFAKDVIAKAGIEVGPIKEHETEELDFVTDPNE